MPPPSLAEINCFVCVTRISSAQIYFSYIDYRQKQSKTLDIDNICLYTNFRQKMSIDTKEKYMRECNKCEHEYADEFDACPHCGATYASEQPQDKSVYSDHGSSIMEKKCAKVAQFEKKRHVIQNVLVLVFSLILFVGSFFMGVNFEYIDPFFASRDTHSSIESPIVKFPIKLNTLQFIDGTLAITYSRGQAMSYIHENEVDDQLILALEEYFSIDDEDPNIRLSHLMKELSNVENVEEFCANFGEKLSQTDINYLKAFLCYNNVGGYYGDTTGSIIGIILGVLIILLQLCVMVSTLVFSIMALIALTKNEQMKRPLLSVLLPLIFMLIAFVLISVNFVYTMTSGFIAMTVISILSVILLAVYKLLFEKHDKDFSVAKLAKNITLCAIGLAACFSVFTPWFTFVLENIKNDLTTTVTVGAHEMLSFIVNDSFVDGTYMVFLTEGTSTFVIMTYVFYIGAATSLITVVLAVCQRLYDNKPNMLLVRSIMSLIMSAICILFVLLINGRYNEKQYNNDLMRVNIVLGAGLFIAALLCIALIAVDAAWKVKASEDVQGKDGVELSEA